MRILEVRERTVPLTSGIRNAVISFVEMTSSVVAVASNIEREGRRLVGYGFNSVGRYAQGGLLRERFIPRILQAPPERLVNAEGTNFDPEAIWNVMMANEKPGGHGERSAAIGAIDMAVWDLVAKIEEQPLFHLLAERFGSGPPRDRVPVYAAGGYYHPGESLVALQDEMRRYLDLGYTAVKMKIGGATLHDDLRRVEAVLEIVGDGSSLAVDANGRFDTATALEYAQALAPYGLRWYEEAGDPLDYVLQAELCSAYEGPLATGENLFSTQDVRNLVRYGGLRPDRDILQMDPALTYGLVEYLRILGMLRDHGWSSRSVIPHGGHQMALHIAAGLELGGSESYPEVFQPIAGFAGEPRAEGGFLSLPGAPGTGLELKANLRPILDELAA